MHICRLPQESKKKILIRQVALKIKGMSHKSYRAYEMENKTIALYMVFDFLLHQLLIVFVFS